MSGPDPGETRPPHGTLNTRMRFNFFRKNADHCEIFYCLSFVNEEFDESFVDYIEQWRFISPKIVSVNFFL